MLVINTHYCLPFPKAVIVCLITVTFGINLFVGLVPLQNSFAQDFDTNGDGVVDAQDDKSASATSSTEEIQMDTNGDGVVDELDETTETETYRNKKQKHKQKQENRNRNRNNTETENRNRNRTTPTEVPSADEIQMDTNGDGVVDELDTPSSEPSTAGATEDTNGDGVVDALDEATATETSTEVPSADEIQMDTNGDGVVDALDEATATETSTEVPSADEIQMDTNGDGVVDALDETTTRADTATTIGATDADAIDTDNDYMPDSTSKPCNPNSPTLRIGKDGTVGSKGPKVTELQSDLADLGYKKFLGPPGIDGKFGPYTEGAVKQFQIDNGLKGKDGIAGPETWTAICDLLSLPNKSKPLYQSQQFNCNPNSDALQFGSKNEKVIELQTYLTDLGYGDLLEPEKIDGKFGPHTKNSVMAYQKDFGLTVDGNGIVGPQTWSSLCEQISSLPKKIPATSVQPPGEERPVSIPEFRCDNASQIKLPFCYDTCGDNIDNDADGQTDDLDPEGCEPGRKVYDTAELTKLNNKILGKLIDLRDAAVASELISVEDDVKFANAVNEFSNNIKRQVLDAVSKSEHMSIPQIITVESLRLWVEDPGNQWGEGSWDSNDLDMSASCYVTVPASQNKCNVYVAEVIFLATGITFKVIESEEKPGQYFPYRAKDWGDPNKTIPHFDLVSIPKMGDVWSNGGHTGIYLGEYNGVKLYISARDNGNGVYGLDSVQHKHGIQIKELDAVKERGIFRTFTP